MSTANDDHDGIPIHFDDHVKPGHFYVINDDLIASIDFTVHYCGTCGGTEYHRATCSVPVSDVPESGPAPEHPA